MTGQRGDPPGTRQRPGIVPPATVENTHATQVNSGTTLQRNPGRDESRGPVGVLARVLAVFGADTVVEQWWPGDLGDLGSHAVAYATSGIAVFPLAPRTKVPLVSRADGGHGSLDATTDLGTIADWWRRCPSANIGLRPPLGWVVVDVDHRHDGDKYLAQVEAEHGPLPRTRTQLTGWGDGSTHRVFRHPGGRITEAELVGIELKTGTGYIVAAPSIHPSGNRYTWREPLDPIVSLPAWFVDIIRPAKPKPPTRPHRVHSADTGGNDSPADWYSTQTSWCDLLGRHGWALIRGNGDDDGSAWRHPTATATVSATVRHDCLFTYSSNTVFPQTAAGDANGITRFRALALLDYGGDLSAAARAARDLRDSRYPR